MNFLIYQLYLLQLENYEIGRYWRLLLRKGYFGIKEPLRQSLVWTAKAKIIFLLALVLWVATSAIFLSADYFFIIAVAVLLLLLFPIFYTIALIILSPIDYFAKLYLVMKTKKIIKKAKDLKIIGIAGSYGKTTMKAVISTVLKEKFNILSTPESVNTPTGIASWFLKNYKKETEILVIEMGEHYRGDIKYLCSMTPPDIAIVTGINEAHLERLGTIENATATIFEIVENVKKDGLILLNADDEVIKEKYEKFIRNKKALFYSSENDQLSSVKISGQDFDEKELSWKFDLDKIDGLRIPILGQYIIGDAVAGYLVANSLEMTPAEIKKGLDAIEPITHRLEPIKSKGDVLIIDDSYNGNPAGVSEAIKVLSLFKDRRKVFLTPGIVESGTKTESIHHSIGQELAKVADKVILVKNSVTPYIAKGLEEGNFSKEDIIWFDTAKEAHTSLGQILKPNDVILFQNDWGDQYL